MQGQYEDEETGLYYNRYRYYDPNISAYVSQDPLGIGAGENVYSYVKNSFGWIDPLGLSCKKNRRQALNEAKDRAGIPKSQQPSRQWEVGNNPKRAGQKNYKYTEDKGSHGRYYEYDTPQGKRVVAEHTNDGALHTHAGKPKPGADQKNYDFKENRYQKINGKDSDHHIYYE